MQEIINSIKKSPQWECALQDCKKYVLPDTMNSEPSKVSHLLAWLLPRFTTNYSTLNSIKQNCKYLIVIFKVYGHSSLANDLEIRGRLAAAVKNLKSFKLMFCFFLSADFLRIMGNMRKTFQDLPKNISQLIVVVNYSISVLEKSRADDYWELFFPMTLRYAIIYGCIEQPTLENIARKRLFWN